MTLDRAAAARMLPLPASCGLQNHITASSHNAFKFGTALQKLALTYLLQYAEYARKYARKYAEYDKKYAGYDKKYAEIQQNMTKYAKQYAEYDKIYVHICSICNLVYCDILRHISHIHIAIYPICPRETLTNSFTS